MTLAGSESAAKGSDTEDRLDRRIRLMKEQGQLTCRIRIRASLQLKEETFTPGMFVRAHLPIPAACDQQGEISLDRVFPETGAPAPEDAPQRTICWEETMTEHHPFEVEYSYLHTAVYHDLEGAKASGEQPTFCTQEEHPHIVFTPYIRNLVRTLTQDTEDPLEKARRFYDFITLNMRYTFMPSYFVLENIAENCARASPATAGCSPCCSSPSAAAQAFPPSGRADWPPSPASAAPMIGTVLRGSLRLAVRRPLL